MDVGFYLDRNFNGQEQRPDRDFTDQDAVLILSTFASDGTQLSGHNWVDLTDDCEERQISSIYELMHNSEDTETENVPTNLVNFPPYSPKAPVSEVLRVSQDPDSFIPISFKLTPKEAKRGYNQYTHLMDVEYKGRHFTFGVIFNKINTVRYYMKMYDGFVKSSNNKPSLNQIPIDYLNNSQRFFYIPIILFCFASMETCESFFISMKDPRRIAESLLRTCDVFEKQFKENDGFINLKNKINLCLSGAIKKIQESKSHNKKPAKQNAEKDNKIHESLPKEKSPLIEHILLETSPPMTTIESNQKKEVVVPIFFSIMPKAKQGRFSHQMTIVYKNQKFAFDVSADKNQDALYYMNLYDDFLKSAQNKPNLVNPPIDHLNNGKRFFSTPIILFCFADRQTCEEFFKKVKYPDRMAEALIRTCETFKYQFKDENGFQELQDKIKSCHSQAVNKRKALKVQAENNKQLDVPIEENFLVDLLNNGDVEPLETLNDLSVSKIIIEELNSNQKEEFKEYYLSFYKFFIARLNDNFLAIFKSILAAERGYFAFRSTVHNQLNDHLKKLFKDFGEKYTEKKLFIEAIANDFYYFFSVYENSDLQTKKVFLDNENKKNQICSKYPAIKQNSDNLINIFLKLKILEYKNYIYNLFKKKTCQVEPRLTPCFFISYKDNVPYIKVLNAYFEDGFLRAIFEDEGQAKNYLLEIFNFPIRNETPLVSYDFIEQLRGVLSSQDYGEDFPFILLEQQDALQFHGDRNKRKANDLPKNERQSKRQRRESNHVKKLSSKSHIISAKDQELIVLEDEIDFLPQQTNNITRFHSTNLAPEDAFTLQGGFWQANSLKACRKVLKKCPRLTRPIHNELRWNLPLISPTPQAKPLFMLQAKPYQQAGIENISHLMDHGLAGILSWWMGLGKSLVGEELIMRHIVSSDGGILVLTENCVIDQLKNEVIERIKKAQYATLLSSAFHLLQFPKDEANRRFAAIKSYIEENKLTLPLSEILNHNHLFIQMKEILILIHALPEIYKIQFHYYLNQYLWNTNSTKILEKHFNSIFQNLDSNEQQDIIDEINQVSKNFGCQIKDGNDVSIIFQVISKEKITKAIQFVAMLLMIDPSYPYKKAQEDSFLGKNFEEFEKITNFSCARQISDYEFDDTFSSYPTHVYFSPYHKWGKRKNSPKIQQFAERANIQLVIADEAHTLGLSRNGVLSEKNIQVRNLFKAIREKTPNCKIVPFSGTFVRGDFDELIELMSTFNPMILPEDTRRLLSDAFSKGVNAVGHIITKKMDFELVASYFETIIQSYAQLLSVNKVLSFLSSKAHPKDENVQRDWHGRFPNKITIREKVSLENVCDEVRNEIQVLESKFSRRGNIQTLQNELSKTLAYCHTDQNSDNKDFKSRMSEALQNIRRAAGNREDLEKELRKSYRASSLLKNPHFIQAIAENKKILVFANQLFTVDILRTFIKSFYQNEFKVHKFNSSVPNNKRKRILSDFKNVKGPQVLIISLGTGSVGLNLPEADALFLSESSWDPAERKQAKYRMLRVNSTGNKEIHVMDKLKKLCFIEQNRQHILDMKKATSKFFSREFKSHEKHLKYFLECLINQFVNVDFKNKRTAILDNEFRLNIRKKLNQYINTEEFRCLLEENDPFRNASPAFSLMPIATTEKGKEKARHVLEKQALQTENTRTINVSKACNKSKYALHEVFSIPLPDMPRINAILAGNALMDSLIDPTFASQIKIFHNTMKIDRSLKEAFVSQGIGALQAKPKAKKFYESFLNVLNGENEESEFRREVHCFKFEDMAYVLVSERELDQSIESIKIFMKSSGDKISYEILIPKHLVSNK